MRFLIAAAFLAMASATIAEAADCQDQKTFQSWQSQCTFVFSYVKMPISAKDEVPTKLALLHDGKRVFVVALVPDWYHRKFFTDRPPVIAVIGKVPHVADRSFLDKSTPPTITIGQDRFSAFSWQGDSRWMAAEDISGRITEALKTGTSATIHAENWMGAPDTANIPLRGFTAAFNHLKETADPTPLPDAWPTASADAISRVAAVLPANNGFRVTTSDLAAVANTRGKGYFVYVKETRFHGVKRIFLWFVGNGAVIKLNGATHNLTPGLPEPQEAEFRSLDGANLLAGELLEHGLLLRNLLSEQ